MTQKQDTETTDMTQHRKDCEHRAWEIIRDAHMPIDWTGGKLEIDFQHLASDIADVIESEESETMAYKENYEEAMRLLGLPAYRNDGQAPIEPEEDRQEYWWVRLHGRIVPANLVIEGGERKVVMFFGTDYSARPDEVEFLSRVLPLTVALPEDDDPSKVAKDILAHLAVKVGKHSVGEEYENGYREACEHVIRTIDEAMETKRSVDVLKLVGAALGNFDSMTSKMGTAQYASGFRMALIAIMDAVRSHRLARGIVSATLPVNGEGLGAAR